MALVYLLSLFGMLVLWGISWCMDKLWSLDNPPFVEVLSQIVTIGVGVLAVLFLIGCLPLLSNSQGNDDYTPSHEGELEITDKDGNTVGYIKPGE